MKFTSEDLMNVMGLKVGDRVAFKYGVDKVICKVNENELEYENGKLPLSALLNRIYEILPAPKRVGDLQCKDFKCDNCPLKVLITCNPYNGSKKLFDILAKWTSAYGTFDQEIYDILKARLDRVVFERQDNMEVKE